MQKMAAATENGIASPDDNAGVIAPPPLIILVTLGAGFGLSALMGSGSLPPGSNTRIFVPPTGSVVHVDVAFDLTHRLPFWAILSRHARRSVKGRSDAPCGLAD
jgi:hypothetical protein